ncbi:hypothetical protein FRB95_006157 [Tulasnella sp. JGI-2019a]|nr:hypothetical protein FRB95_006157 [Tulasnella sp. JGI-2019a]
MPIRNPVLSPLTLLNGNDPASAHGAMTSYLSGTSVVYDDSDEDDDEQQQQQPGSEHGGDVESLRPTFPHSPGSIASGGAGSVQGFPGRYSIARRGSQNTFKSYRRESDAGLSDTPEIIRSRTASLSDMPFRRRLSSSAISPLSAIPPLSAFSIDGRFNAESNESRASPRELGSSFFAPAHAAEKLTPIAERAPPRGEESSSSTGNSSASASPSNVSPPDGSPSGLSRLIAREKIRSGENSPERLPRDQPTVGNSIHIIPTVVVRKATRSEEDAETTPTPTRVPPRTDRAAAGTVDIPDDSTTPLLSSATATLAYGTSDTAHSHLFSLSSKSTFGRTSSTVRFLAQRLRQPRLYKDIATDAVSSIPAVILGLLLNILDGLSYGFIMFPAGSVFAGFGSIGVSMFFVTTIVSQLVYSLGGSSFAGANGSMMIEVVPFFHLIANGILEVVGDDTEAVIATTMVAFSFSAFITGLTFFVLGHFKLGNIIGFFPRHILVGCIGGVGVFLVETGLEVSASVNADDGFQYNLSTFKLFFMNSKSLTLWLPPFAIAVLFRLLTTRAKHQLVFPLYFMSIPCIFYIVKAILGIDLDTLRNSGWVFDVGSEAVPWYQFYTYFKWHKTSFKALIATMPTQLALLFFNILHPPLNVPALAVSLNADNVDTNRELVAHGISNVLASFLGTVPNYLVYVNTLMFYRVGGGSRISGLLLAAGTAVLLVVGTGPIGFIPIMLVGALIFVLGIDLIKEAVWDTRHRTSRSEYGTIIAIMICMSLWDFVTGVLFGIVLACFFFVIQSSKEQSIRALYSGSSSTSAVRRPSAHREYLRAVGKQTAIMRLQGFLFFGTINHVEDTIRRLLDAANWEQQPIRFLIIDLSLVGGLDMSSAEAFVRLHRLLVEKGIILIFCGMGFESAVAKALKAVDLWTDRALNVEIFEELNQAMEWSENAYLRAWFSAPRQQKIEPAEPMAFPGQLQRTPIALSESFANSPRQNHLHDAGTRIMAPEMPETLQAQPTEPVNTLLKAFSSLSRALDESFLAQLVPYLKQVAVPEGHVLFKTKDTPDGMYFIEHGVLRATYQLADFAQNIEESMVSGTIAGELSALSGMPRNATVVAERQSVLWKLSVEDMERLEKDQPETAKAFVKLVLKAAKTDYDVLLSSMANRV